METIKNYLEAMFASMPNTESVRRAKDEIYSMMEDKYNELKADGVSENEAIGTVISEFGNLDEIAGELGLEKEVKQEKEYKANIQRRFVSGDEVRDYLSIQALKARLVALGVMFCIICACPCIVCDVFGLNELFGVVGLVILLAIAIGAFVYQGQQGWQYDYIKNSPCQIDMSTSSFVADAKRKFEPTHSIMTTVGILLCCFCWVPAAIFDGNEAIEDLTGGLVLIFVGIGVYLLVYGSSISGSYDTILKINDENTISGNYERGKVYINKTVATIMAVFQPTIVCVYFIWSFLTFDWELTWIIFPIGAIVKRLINMNFMVEENGND